MRRVLVAGVGNVFLGDDGFGCAVAQRLTELSLPSGVHVEDYGIRGVHLAYTLLEGYETLVLVDAAPRGEAPGTLFVLEPDFEHAETLERGESGFMLDAHGMDPEMVIGILRDLGGTVPRVRIVGCEPLDVRERMGLSAPVADAVGRAVLLVQQLVAAECARDAAPPPAPLQPEQEVVK